MPCGPGPCSHSEEQGIDSIAEIKEAELEEELARSMQLKPAKQKLLIKRLAEL